MKPAGYGGGMPSAAKPPAMKPPTTRVAATNMGPKGFTLQQKQQIATRMRKKVEGAIRKG